MNLPPLHGEHPSRLSRLRNWFDSEAGRQVLAVERQLLHPELRRCHGHYLLQLGADPGHCLTDDVPVSRTLIAGLEPALALSICCSDQALPLASESIDVVLLHHVLECTEAPHAVLREVQRIIAPGGRVFILAFNPWSALGLCRLCNRLGGRSDWPLRHLSAQRLLDWLQLLGFDVAPPIHALHGWPLAAPGFGPAAGRAWQRHCPGGSLLLLCGIKRVSAALPRRPQWAPAPSLELAGMGAELGRRVAQENLP